MPKSKRKQTAKSAYQPGPWIQMRTGVVIIAITSIGLAVLIIVQVWSYEPPLQAILSGLFYGALIWAIFLGLLLFNRITGRGQK